ncbi:S-adenosyl-L-methionine-dependent methyltransferase [Lipomyces arxii]|uniref:S-adenosyl-L-methionine-dependent methyltransferase n=1 Tax=Lipomyces arxii TaxID=56418 RepID=UPI0034CF1164
MNLYLDASKFVSASSSYANYSTDNFAGLQTQLQNSLDKLKSDPKRVFALLRSTIRYKEILDDVLKQSEILKQEKVAYNIALPLIHDYLISKTGITAGKGPLKDAILRHKTRLKAELIKIKIKRGIKDLNEFNVSTHDRTIRWIRVNALIPSDLTANLPYTPTSQFPPPVGTIYADPYIPSLYALANSHTRQLLSLPAYQKGQLIMQDRASCFPAYILSPESGETVIDACAAPGNKTSHLAALMQNKGKIIAFELNSDRADVLQRMVTKAGASIVRVENRDFTGSLPKEYKHITKLLCDPSCSGSGIFRKEQFVASADTPAAPSQENPDSEEFNEQSEDPLVRRLQNLSIFQTQIMIHALTKFPKANKVVYSTCSIHGEENEDVVRNLISDPEIQDLGWRVVPRERVIPDWHRRGWQDRFEGIDAPQSPHEIAEGCIRAEPVVDGGIGFFVVAFEKVAQTKKRQRPNVTVTQPVTVEEENFDDEEWTGFEDDVEPTEPISMAAKKSKKKKKTKKLT